MSMKSSLSILARRAVFVASRRAAAASPAVAKTFARAMSTQAARDFSSNMDITKPAFAVDSPDGEFDGHLTEELAEVNRLIDAQAASAEDASAILRDRAAAAKTIAVDAPDGEDDAHYAEEMLEIANIIDAQAKLVKGASAILRNRAADAETFAESHALIFARKKYVSAQDIIDEVNHLNEKPTNPAFAVDSPDGDDDGHLAEELAEVARLIDAQAASAEDASTILRDRAAAAKTIAVDAPDGEDDAHYAEELLEIAKIIDAQAKTAEVAGAILTERAAAAKTIAVDAPDGEVDGHLLEEMEEIKRIIDDAAKFEDKEAVNQKHEWEKKEEVEAEKHPEKDW